jgi:hypothetical protein
MMLLAAHSSRVCAVFASSPVQQYASNPPVHLVKPMRMYYRGHVIQ